MAAEVVSIFDVRDFDGQIRRGGDVLQSGGVVVLPTETVYGAAAALKNSKGLDRLRALPPEAARGKPLVVHLANSDDAKRFVGEIGDLGRRMIKKLWPGPVALVFDVPAGQQERAAGEWGVSVGELYEKGTITLRCPDHMVASEVIQYAGGPVVMRKIAGSGQSIEEMDAGWRDQVELIFDAGRTRYSKPSTILKVSGEKYEIARTGVYDQRIIENLLRTTVLFVCSGNTCRSPMAEAIARQQIAGKLGVSEAELEKKGVVVLSAGSFAMPGAKATPAAVEALKLSGADLSRHRSRPLTVELIHQADVIYTMGRGHAQAVMALAPSAADKVATLDPDGDIDDPIGGDVSIYHTLAGQLRTLIEKRLAEKSIP
jgi:protein-tyrosine phosphatase